MSGGRDDAYYVLGHSAEELGRLDLQDRVYGDITSRALADGGVGPGMRVLDLGCGSGAVSRRVSLVVGDTGAVVGVDRSAESIDFARARAAAAGLENVEYVRCGIEELVSSEPFDAVVGRFVLMHQPDPVATLRAAIGHLRPGGPVVAIESSAELLERGVRSRPPLPLYDAVVDWKAAVIRRAGADADAALRLPGIFLDAGLPRPSTRLEAPLAHGPESIYFDYLEHSVRSLWSEGRGFGAPDFDACPIDDLAARLRAEAARHEGVLVGWPVVAAWSRRPPR